MKLLKKLLPITALSTSVIGLMPAITSCAASQTLVIGEKFKPTITQTVGNFTNDEATNKYFQDIKSNNKIFIEDYLWNAYLNTEFYIEYRITDITITLNKIDTEAKTIDYKTNFTTKIGDKVSKSEASLTNFPMAIKYHENFRFLITGSVERLKNETKWQIKFAGDYLLKIFGTDNVNNSNATEEFYNLVKESSISSYYLYNCKYSKQDNK